MDMVQHIEWELFKFTVHIVIKPKFSVSIAQNSSNDIVLIDNRNTALNTNLSSSSSNVWEFQIGSNWYQYPENSSSISISGNSLFSTLKSQYSALGNFIDLIGYQTIRVRHKLECLPSYSNEIVLHPKLASPTVSNIVTTPPTCHGASDGKAVIRFSRAVYNKELLQFAVKGISGIAHTVPPGSDTFTLTGLSAGIDTIIISGKYPYNN
ncbi:MAG: hypothetical protein LBD59_09355 [Prevotellaceae bacterium]|nr:hypothetical protein [Prevotellaceae bacterium]